MRATVLSSSELNQGIAWSLCGLQENALVLMMKFYVRGLLSCYGNDEEGMRPCMWIIVLEVGAIVCVRPRCVRGWKGRQTTVKSVLYIEQWLPRKNSFG